MSLPKGKDRQNDSLRHLYYRWTMENCKIYIKICKFIDDKSYFVQIFQGNLDDIWYKK